MDELPATRQKNTCEAGKSVKVIVYMMVSGEMCDGSLNADGVQHNNVRAVHPSFFLQILVLVFVTVAISISWGKIPLQLEYIFAICIIFDVLYYHMSHGKLLQSRKKQD